MTNSVFVELLKMDARLVASGMFGLTPFWRQTLERWYSHPTAKTLVARVGRGGAKSHTAVKVAVAEVLFGNWKVPPGELHYFAFVSLSKDEAFQRLTLIKQILTVLGVAFEASGDVVSLPELQLGFRVFACQIGAVSGFRCVGYSADEAAKWENADHSANPAAEVCTSLDSMCITRPNARRLIISSPWGMDDLHYTLFERGEQRDQVVAFATSWEANPGITRQQCEDASRGDSKVFAREYSAEPGTTVAAALDAVDVDYMFDVESGYVDGTRGFCAIDSSSLKHDGFGYVAGFAGKEGIHVDTVGEFTKANLQGRDKYAIVVHSLVGIARAHRTNMIYGDHHEEAGLTSLFMQQGITFKPYAWSTPSKEQAFSELRQLLRTDHISCIPNEQLRKEMLNCQQCLLPSGVTQYRTNGLDVLSALISLMHAIVDKQVNADAGSAIDWAEHDRLRVGIRRWRM